MTLKRQLYERLYFVYYSVKEIKDDIINFIKEFRKPKMWLLILYVTFFVAVWKRNLKLVWTVLPLIFIVYLIRQKKDTKWRGELFEKDLRRNIDSDIVKEHYKRYTKNCHFSHKEPIGMNEWKKSEIRRLDEKHKNDRDVRH